MFDQDIYQKTIKFSGEYHKDQKIPASNISYIVHLSNVCMETIATILNSPNENYDINYAMQCALLHDVIEDTEATYQDVLNIFGKRVADGVMALTKSDLIKDKKEKMLDSLERILKTGDEIRIVKMADRIVNLQKPPSDWSHEKSLKYKDEATVILNTLGGINTYIENRLLNKIKIYESMLG